MNVSLEYSAEEKTPFDQTFLEQIAEITLKHCPADFFAGKDAVTLNAVSVSREKIQELNKTYRQKDAVTDILSFGEYADTQALKNDPAKTVFLGELFFCQDFIKEAAVEDGVTLEHEMVYIFSHGVLHLLGYDHSDEMFAIQDAVTEKLVVQSK